MRCVSKRWFNIEKMELICGCVCVFAACPANGLDTVSFLNGGNLRLLDNILVHFILVAVEMYVLFLWGG